MRNYWMADPNSTAVINKMSQYHGQWTIWGSNPVCQAWVRNTVAYYSTVMEPNDWNTSLIYEGEQGELVKMSVPEARSLVRQLVTITTKQRLHFTATAKKQDADVVNDVKLGNALGAHIVDKQMLHDKSSMMCEQALIWGQAYMLSEWRTDRGRMHSVGDNGNILFDGDLEISVPSVFDVFYDYTVQNFYDLEWVEIRTGVNKWDLVAQYPNMADKIIALPSISEVGGTQRRQYTIISEEDMVYVYKIYHKPTPALPYGRMLFYGSNETVFYDGPNEYECIPLRCMRPQQITGVGFGYPFLSNLLPAQEMLDHSFSAIATNQSAHAVQNVLVPRGAGISVQDINGMNWISFNPQNVPGGGEPKALQLSKSSPETFQFIDLVSKYMMNISAVNSTLRGSPPPGATSGVAIATLTANALEFVNDVAQSYNSTLERVMGDSITCYRNFAKVPHVINIVGKKQKAQAREFVGRDLEAIDSMKITATNPMLQTMAGRTEIAEKMLASGLIKSAQDYVAILEGAPLQQLTEVELSGVDLVQSENEAMLEGREVPVLITDDHPYHIMKHASLLDDPEIRLHNEHIGIIMDHIMEHDQMARIQDPFLTAMVRTGKMPEGGPPMPEPPMGEVGLEPSNEIVDTQLPPAPGPQGPESVMPTGMPAKPANDMLGRNQ